MNTAMGVKENIDNKPKIKLGLAIGLILISIVFSFWYIRSNRSPAAPTQSYYSNDDGISWFADTPGKITPFDHNGKSAVACFVLDGSKGRIAAYLEKYSDSYRLLAMKSANSQGVETNASQGLVLRNGLLVKRPGNFPWVSVNTADGQQIEALGMQGTPVSP